MFSFAKKSSVFFFLYIFKKYNFYELYEIEVWYIDYNIYWLWQSMLERSIQFNVNKIKYETIFLYTLLTISHVPWKCIWMYSWVVQYTREWNKGLKKQKIKINFFHIALESCLIFFLHFSQLSTLFYDEYKIFQFQTIKIK